MLVANAALMSRGRAHFAAVDRGVAPLARSFSDTRQVPTRPTARRALGDVGQRPLLASSVQRAMRLTRSTQSDMPRQSTPSPPVRVPPTGMASVFLSYRRDDASGYARELRGAIEAQLGPQSVFMDLRIAPGDNFVERIRSALEATNALLVVIGPHWLDHKSRLSRPDDWVRTEIEVAFVRGIRVIPVLVGGSQVPSRTDLPQAIHGLADRQAVELRDPHWRTDVSNLLNAITELAPRSGRAQLMRGVRATEVARVWQGAQTPGFAQNPFIPFECRAVARLPALVYDDERVMYAVYSRLGTVKAPSGSWC